MTGLEFLLLLVIGGYAAKHAVVDGASAVRGKTPPSHEKWHKRQQNKQKRGEKPADKPGYWKTVWSNAAAEWAEKNRHRHQERMDYIRAREPQKGERWRDKKLRRAAQWDAARDRAAERGGVAWQRLRSAPAALADRRVEAEAHKLNAQFDAEQAAAETGEQASTEQAGTTDTPDDTTEPKEDTTEPDTASTVPSPQQLTETQGEHAMSQPTGEITNLAEAVQFCQAMSDYFGQVVSQFEEPAAQATQAATDLGQAPSIVENATAALAGAGFGQQVTGPLAQAGESASAAAAALDDVAKRLATATEQVTAAGAAFGQAKQALNAQQGLAEQVQAHKSGGSGVAKDTEFYANA